MSLDQLWDEVDTFRRVRANGLPIFRQDRSEYSLFYAPRYLCLVNRANADCFEDGFGIVEKPADVSQTENICRSALRSYAEFAVQAENRLRAQAFQPECLTLYLHNECNLRCVYCFTDPSLETSVRLDLRVVAEAAEMVAENCKRKGQPFFVVFHGGGEPTLHYDQIGELLGVIEKIATTHQVDLFRYVATNGVMSEEHALWLARHFDLIGLSCDGPAPIQNANRPRRDGQATSTILERTVRLWLHTGIRLQIRTTITRSSLDRQEDIARYLCEQFAPEEIHFEPVYVAGRAKVNEALTSSLADEFVAHFLKAQSIARGFGVPLLFSGSRPSSIHGSYCNIFRNVLNLVPGGVATACFKLTHAAQVVAKDAAVARTDSMAGQLQIDQPHIRDLVERLSGIPSHCAPCFNRYHCVRECPDRCPLDRAPFGRTDGLREPAFRCRVQKMLAYSILKTAAEGLWQKAREMRIPVHGTTMV